MYRRPSTLEEVVHKLELLRTVEVRESAVVQQGLCRLSELRWYARVLQPLYDANQVVKLAAHSLTPMVQQLIFEDALGTMRAQVRASDRARFAAEYDAIRVRVRDACADDGRVVTKQFAEVRAAMAEYVADAAVQDAIGALFEVSKSARFAIRLMSERLTECLRRDCEVRVSNDVPLSAVWM